jgi:hypothetical protein
MTRITASIFADTIHLEGQSGKTLILCFLSEGENDLQIL